MRRNSVYDVEFDVLIKFLFSLLSIIIISVNANFRFNDGYNDKFHDVRLVFSNPN